MLMFRSALLLCALFGFVTVSFGQIPKNNPVVDWSVGLGQTGFSAASGSKSASSRFKPSGNRVFLSEFLAALLPDEAERKAFRPVIDKIIEGFEDSAKQGGFEHETAGSMAFAVYALYSLGKGIEVPTEALSKLIDRYRAFYDSGSLKAASDRHKQEVYEWALGSAALLLALAAQAEEASVASKVQTMAKAQLQVLTGAEFEQFELKGQDLICRASPPPAKPIEEAGLTLAPGFQLPQPSGWERLSGWFVRSEADRSDVTSAMFRFPPPIAASGNMGDALRKQWALHIPAELANAAGGMVYRRYVGNKLFAQFVFGKGIETGRRSVTLFTLMLIDCGKYWQPVVIAQRYDSSGFEENHAPFTFPKSWSFAEQFLAGLRCDGAPNHAIASVEDLAGDYRFGSGSKMDYVNIYTGATAFSYVSYGGELNLAPDGSFTYRYSSASGVGGAASFRGATGSGKWSIQGDILTCRFTRYDQGDGYMVKEHSYRIAGLTSFSDGVKVAVLISDLSKPISSASVADGSQWYSTKK
jgi:hypothetical protein